jgi:hypothetical protein
MNLQLFPKKQLRRLTRIRKKRIRKKTINTSNVEFTFSLKYSKKGAEDNSKTINVQLILIWSIELMFGESYYVFEKHDQIVGLIIQ